MAQPLSFRHDNLHHYHPSSSSASMTRAPSQLDEGYSEDTRSQDADSEMTYSTELDTNLEQILAMANMLPEEMKRRLIERLIGTLPNAQKEEVGKYCVELTHFDPASKLPNELMYTVLSYLGPKDLLASGAVSRIWRERAQDEKLWRCCFAREGWLVDRSKLDIAEADAKRTGTKYAEAVMKGTYEAKALERKGSRKRKPNEAFSDGEAGQSGDEDKMESVAGTSVLGHASGSDSDSMEGVERIAGYGDGTVRAMSPSEAFMGGDHSGRSSTSHDSGTSMHSHSRSFADEDASSFSPSPKPFRRGPPENPKLSWPYLYKHRARLEKNWEKENAHSMFSLPHPDYPEEGHGECVYTIQHTSKHLVSGSRDKTIRRWTLDDCRLMGEPLTGHDASVLCLQFDEREEHDIIVSGGSDAYLIIWRFSTGEIIKKIKAAHRESVLNLRFDDRYIVTCSKDKTIKIWNRNQISKKDPLIPTFKIAELEGIPDRLSDTPGPWLPAYYDLATLIGHQAAVNAVMIHGNTIISASGDRTIKSWDIKEARMKKTYQGHTKGIACVQFDGRRIVSGSSDNTVRIFDAENAAEVACLAGHANLVRTVQARFGDLETVTDEELETEARAADRAFYRAIENGMAPASVSRGATRNAGSSRPEDMLSVGNKVPPGGGGSRWAKIVSGSYDESVIIWKRDRDGKWAKKVVLKQDDLLHMHFGQELQQQRRAAERAARALPRVPYANGVHVPPGPAAGNGPPAPGGHGANMTNALHHITQLSQALAGVANGGQVVQQAVQQAVTTQVQQNQQQQNGANTAVAAGPANAPPQHAPPPAAANPPPPAAPQIQPQQQLAAAPQQHVHAAVHHAGQGHNRAHASESNRVFKLQFDARRIICCSQNKVIVGWDFANGDPELERVGGWSLETA